MKKFVCTVCGYVFEGEAAPEFCPICKAPAEKFKEQSAEKTWAAEHVVGVAQGVDEEILAGEPEQDVRDPLRCPMRLETEFRVLVEVTPDPQQLTLPEDKLLKNPVLPNQFHGFH